MSASDYAGRPGAHPTRPIAQVCSVCKRERHLVGNGRCEPCRKAEKRGNAAAANKARKKGRRA